MDEFSGRSDSLSTLVALHTYPVILHTIPKLNNVIIEGVGVNQDNQGALRILKLSLLGNGCPKKYVGILTMPWEKN